MAELLCRHISRCGGCPIAFRPLWEQRQAKKGLWHELFPTAEICYLPVSRVRDRVDLIWEDGRLGLYESNSRNILALEECPMMSARLENFFHEFRVKAPPIRKGSVRLRVSPRGEKGAWLDFANQDVKHLFDEKEYLKWLASFAFVEIGQRRKALVWKDDQPKLVDPILKDWFESYDREGRAIPLYGPVGGFSQAGFEANRALIDVTVRAVEKSGVKSWVELFAGNGNLAVALAARGCEVEAVELEELAVEGLKKTLHERPDLTVQISKGDVYLKPERVPDWSGRGLLVDPPRAGLRQLLDRLKSGPKPEVLVYVSCFAEVFVEEVKALRGLGYRLETLEGVDQFPHSPHCEWIGLFRLSGS